MAFAAARGRKGKVLAYLSWHVRRDEVKAPPTVVPATERPGLDGKVSVHETSLEKDRGGVTHVMGLRTAVSEHFLTETIHWLIDNAIKGYN